jgi:hypothetical protein
MKKQFGKSKKGMYICVINRNADIYKTRGRKGSIGVDWVRRHVGAELTSLTTGSSL